MATTRRILVIAGSDSSGGAGLEADQKVIAAHGCYAMTATTALTAQNTQGVVGILETPAAFVIKQIAACVDDVGVDVIKIGMLASAETAASVADYFRQAGVAAPIVLDPVMVASTGAQLLSPDAVQVVVEKLLPMAALLTPNIPEAKLLLGKKDAPDPSTKDEMVQTARELLKLGPRYVLLKGGHLDPHRSPDGRQPGTIVDVLCWGDAPGKVLAIEKESIVTKHTHGTGCSLASAVASHIALGEKVADAVREACHYVEAGIRTAIPLGKGAGPINHFHSSFILPFAPGRFLDYLLHRKDVKDAWRSHTEHVFVQKMANGTLPPERFKSYLVQDYLFLVQFARVKALAASKQQTIDDIAAGADEIVHIRREMELHIKVCEEFGLSRTEIENSRASQACVAYTRYILDQTNSSDWFASQVACAPCLIGYGHIAKRLFEDPATVKGSLNPYWQWIETYVAEDYVKAVNKGKQILEKHAVLQSRSRIEELVKVFIVATRLETGFWGMAEATGENPA